MKTEIPSIEAAILSTNSDEGQACPMMRSRISSPVVSFTSGFQMYNVDVSSTNGLECIRIGAVLMASAKFLASDRLRLFARV